LKESEYFDTWMLVEKTVPAAQAPDVEPALAV